MKKLNLVVASDILACSEQVICDLAPFVNDLDKPQIVIVPDRYSFLTEKLIFEKLKIQATLNIKVIGINRFASLVMSNLNIDKKSMSKSEQIVRLGKAVVDSANSFKFFPKTLNDVGFVQQIKNTISQLKTSLITPDKLENLAQTNKKIHDIHLIYKNYEEVQKQGLMDSADFIDCFIECGESPLIKNSRFSFVFFDSLTRQGLEVLNMLVSKSQGVEFALCYPDENQNNKFVYDKELYQNIVEIARENNIEIDEKRAGSANFISNVISSNIYLNNPKSVDCDMLELFECNSMQSEAQMIAKRIRKEVVLGRKYGDFVVGVSNIEKYAPMLMREFQRFDIPAYFDMDESILQTQLSKFIFEVLAHVGNNYQVDTLKNLLINDFVGLEVLEREKLLNLIDKYSELGSATNLTYFEKEEEYVLSQKLNNINSQLFVGTSLNEMRGETFCQYILNVLDVFNCKDKMDKIVETFKLNGDIERQKQYSVLFEKTLKIIGDFKEVVEGEVLPFNQFVILLKNVFEASKISIIPMRADHVFVGDVSKSFFDGDKFFFLCGANQDSMPDFQTDVGLISDKDIKTFSSSIKIGPAIRTINIRKRLKLCSVLSIPKQRLIVSWQAYDENCKARPKSIFIECLRKMLKVGGKSVEISKAGFSNDYQQNPNVDQYLDFAEYVCNAQNGKRALVNHVLNGTNQNVVAFNSLYEVLKKKDSDIENLISNINRDNDIENLKQPLNVFFRNNKFSVSEMETFAKCPFMHFAKYGLKLQEDQPIELNSANIGSIEHYVLEQFFKEKYDRNRVENGVEQIFKKLEINPDYKIYFMFSRFASTLKAIKRECVRVIKLIIQEQENSNFKMEAFEYKFGKTGLKFKVGDREIRLGGIVDRIDKFGNKVIIIDYKTGKVEHKPKDIIYGNKIQVFVYSTAIENEENVECVGALYFPISMKKAKNKSAKMFEGFFVNNSTCVKALDKKLTFPGESEYLRGVFKEEKDGKIVLHGNYSSSLCDKEEFEDWKEYCQEILKVNLDNIASGYIKCSPLGDTCRYCKFHSLCGFDELSGNCSRREKINKYIKNKE